jgi:hypothetical protein
MTPNMAPFIAAAWTISAAALAGYASFALIRYRRRDR